MKFIYSETLKEKFDVFGHFYNLQLGDYICQCRSLLTIVSKEMSPSSKELPDAVFVMMNPGSSRPLDKSYLPKTYSHKEIFSNKWVKEIIPTRPDNAQYQIMRLMLLNNWLYVKVLNLSDLRNGNSGEFRKEYQLASEYNPSHPHCITHLKRRNELLNELKRKSKHPVIAAWGSLDVLADSANEMLNLNPKIIGLKVNHPWYKYASPYLKTKKLEWLTNMNKLVNL